MSSSSKLGDFSVYAGARQFEWCEVDELEGESYRWENTVLSLKASEVLQQYSAVHDRSELGFQRKAMRVVADTLESPCTRFQWRLVFQILFEVQRDIQTNGVDPETTDTEVIRDASPLKIVWLDMGLSNPWRTKYLSMCGPINWQYRQRLALRGGGPKSLASNSSLEQVTTPDSGVAGHGSATGVSAARQYVGVAPSVMTNDELVNRITLARARPAVRPQPQDDEETEVSDEDEDTLCSEMEAELVAGDVKAASKLAGSRLAAVLHARAVATARAHRPASSWMPYLVLLFPIAGLYLGSPVAAMVGGVAACYALGHRTARVDQTPLARGLSSVVTYGVNKWPAARVAAERFVANTTVKHMRESCPFSWEFIAVCVGVCTMIIGAFARQPKRVENLPAICRLARKSDRLGKESAMGQLAAALAPVVADKHEYSTVSAACNTISCAFLLPLIIVRGPTFAFSAGSAISAWIKLALGAVQWLDMIRSWSLQGDDVASVVTNNVKVIAERIDLHSNPEAAAAEVARLEAQYVTDPSIGLRTRIDKLKLAAKVKPVPIAFTKILSKKVKEHPWWCAALVVGMISIVTSAVFLLYQRRLKTKRTFTFSVPTESGRKIVHVSENGEALESVIGQQFVYQQELANTFPLAHYGKLEGKKCFAKKNLSGRWVLYSEDGTFMGDLDKFKERDEELIFYDRSDMAEAEQSLGYKFSSADWDENEYAEWDRKDRRAANHVDLADKSDEGNMTRGGNTLTLKDVNGHYVRREAATKPKMITDYIFKYTWRGKTTWTCKRGVDCAGSTCPFVHEYTPKCLKEKCKCDKAHQVKWLEPCTNQSCDRSCPKYHKKPRVKVTVGDHNLVAKKVEFSYDKVVAAARAKAAASIGSAPCLSSPAPRQESLHGIVPISNARYQKGLAKLTASYPAVNGVVQQDFSNGFCMYGVFWTAHHCVPLNTKVEVEFASGVKATPATWNHVTGCDVAWSRINVANVTNFQPGKEPQPNDTVHMRVWCLLTKDWVMMAGRVTSVADGLLHYSIKTTEGYSGAAVFDEKGHVVAIHTNGASVSGGPNFGVLVTPSLVAKWTGSLNASHPSPSSQ